jgi:serine phosphatase RsbU (regulator of sigma subunit)
MTPAGHPAPILLTADSCQQIEIAEPGPPIGIFDNAEWPVIHFQLPEGGTLFLFTDGLVEARRDGELFGIDGVCALLERERGVALEERIVRLIDAARRFDAANLRDDVVVMAIDRPRAL